MWLFNKHHISNKGSGANKKQHEPQLRFTGKKIAMKTIKKLKMKKDNHHVLSPQNRSPFWDNLLGTPELLGTHCKKETIVPLPLRPGEPGSRVHPAHLSQLQHAEEDSLTHGDSPVDMSWSHVEEDSLTHGDLPADMSWPHAEEASMTRGDLPEDMSWPHVEEDSMTHGDLPADMSWPHTEEASMTRGDLPADMSWPHVEEASMTCEDLPADMSWPHVEEVNDQWRPPGRHVLATCWGSQWPGEIPLQTCPGHMLRQTQWPEETSLQTCPGHMLRKSVTSGDLLADMSWPQHVEEDPMTSGDLPTDMS